MPLSRKQRRKAADQGTPGWTHQELGMGTRKIDQKSHDVATGITLAAAAMVIGLIVLGNDATPHRDDATLRRESPAVLAPIVSVDTAVPAFEHFFDAFAPDAALGAGRSEAL